MGNTNQTLSIEQAIQVAFRHHQSGQLPEAEAIYRQILQVAPNHPDALHLLGLIARQAGKPDLAVELIGKALTFVPECAEAHNNLGNSLNDQGKPEEAVASYRRAIGLKPGYAEAHFSLANALKAQGKLDEAAGSYLRVLALDPVCAGAHNNLGAVRQQQGRLDEAAAAYRQALVLKPDYVDAHYNLGIVLQAQGKPEEAAASYRAALSIQPNHAEAHTNLGNVFTEQGRMVEAIESFRTAINIRPGYAVAYNNLGNALQIQGQLEEAAASYRAALSIQPEYVAALNNLGGALQEQNKLAEASAIYRQVLSLEPDYAMAYSNLGNSLQTQGQLVEAVACCRKALALKPDSPDTHSNLIFTLDMDTGVDTSALQAERQRWGEAHANALYVPIAHSNSPEPERRLRIGYVSADFRNHSAAKAFGAMLVRFDPAAFDVYAYSNSSIEDRQTQLFQQSVTCWRKIRGLTDAAVVELIRQDGIDILVDLSGHSRGNRLLAFARKPAPIQITAWGYIGGTGLKVMDVFLADPVVVPPEEKAFYTEEIRYLPNVVSAYFSSEFPEVNALPAASADSVTFGSFNRLCKISAETYQVWSQILQAIPDSRMLLKTQELDDPGTRKSVLGHFIRAGVNPGRIILLGKTSWHEHMAAFNRIDITLDPFPHGGGVTTLEGLMMGVPLITLRWPTLAGRLSASILTTLDMTDWIAETPQQYIDLAIEKAGDLKALAELRQNLRPRFKASIIGDTAAYARAVEGEYRKLWREWCGRQANA